MSEIPRYLTVREVAERLGKREWCVCYWIRSGLLRAVPVGKSYLIPVAALNRFTPPALGRRPKLKEIENEK